MSETFDSEGRLSQWGLELQYAANLKLRVETLHALCIQETSGDFYEVPTLCSIKQIRVRLFSPCDFFKLHLA